MAEKCSFPIGYGASAEHRDLMGAWWMEPKSALQPTEFILDASGKVMTSSYSSGPLGRISAENVIKMVTSYEAKKNK